MYLEFFHFARSPFVNTADPASFYPSEAHREALATLLYGINERKGLIVLTGPVGSGKTMVLRKLIQDQPGFRCIFLTNPWINKEELFARLLNEWGEIPAPSPGCEPLGLLQTALSERLQKEDALRFVLLADEAHLLSEQTLEAIRLLLNLEEERGKLVQIVLSGQEELAAILRQHHLRPLLQRVALVEHLQPFDLDDTIGYVQHRLRAAGGDPYIFPRPCLEWIHRESRGIPRLINQICDHALIFAFGRQSRSIERQDVEAALAKLPLGAVFLEPEEQKTPPPSDQKKVESELPEEGTAQANQSAPEKEKTQSAARAGDALDHSSAEGSAVTAPDIAGLVGSRAAAQAFNPDSVSADAMRGISLEAPAAGYSQPGAQGREKNLKWAAPLMSAAVALVVGAAVAYWWLQTGSSQLAPSGARDAAEALSRSPKVFESPPNLNLSPYPQTSMRGVDSGPSNEYSAASLPLPVIARSTDLTVNDGKELLAALSKHFGIDNASIRDLFMSMNPAIDPNRISANTRVKLPQPRREEMIVTDARGRFYIYYATVADDQLAATVKQRIAPLGVQSAQFPVVVGGQTVFRIYLGPFATRDEASRVVELLRFTFIPILERGEGASGL